MDYSKKPGKEIKKIGELKREQNCQITIVTPFYNGGKTISETANSVFSQTYPFFEGNKETPIQPLLNQSKHLKHQEFFLLQNRIYHISL